MIDISINLAYVAFNVQRYNIQEVLNKINIAQNKINNFVNSPVVSEHQFALLIIKGLLTEREVCTVKYRTEVF